MSSCRWNANAVHAVGEPHSAQRIQQIDDLQSQGLNEQRYGRIGALASVPCPVNVEVDSKLFRAWLLVLPEGTNLPRSASAYGRSAPRRSLYDFFATTEEIEAYRQTRTKTLKEWISGVLTPLGAMDTLDNYDRSRMNDNDAVYHIRCRACGQEALGTKITEHRCALVQSGEVAGAIGQISKSKGPLTLERLMSDFILSRRRSN